MTDRVHEAATIRLSQTIANIILTQSPRHAWAAHPLLGGIERKPTGAMELGTIVHELVLGKGDGFVEVDAPDWRTKAAQTQRDDARAAGKTPVLTGELAEARIVAGDVLRQLGDKGIVLAGQSELRIEWDETTTDGTPVACSGKLDHVVGAMVFDLKMCRSAHPAKLMRSCIEYGYHVQAHAYLRAYSTVRPDLADEIDFAWIFVEIEPVVTVTLAQPGPDLRAMGTRRWQRAVDIWARCLAADRWPGYADGVAQIEAPAWAIREEYENAA